MIMKKKFIRLTESDLHRIIKTSVHRILNEGKQRIPKAEILELIDDANNYESGYVDIWMDECIEPPLCYDFDECLKIWLMAHPEDREYYMPN